jgi:hypothetical protein
MLAKISSIIFDKSANFRQFFWRKYFLNRLIGPRWNDIVRDVEERLAANRDFQMVEVENIKTTISHMRIPATEPVITMSSGVDFTYYFSRFYQNIFAQIFIMEKLCTYQTIHS